MKTKIEASVIAIFFLATMAMLSACSEDTTDLASEPGALVDDIADRYYARALRRAPEQAFLAGVDVDRHDGLYDNSLEALADDHAFEDRLISELDAIDIDELAGRAEWVTAALLIQRLQADLATRICRRELWNVNQIGGWHLEYTQLAQLQPVDTPEHRAQALGRWSNFHGFVDQEIKNLETGIHGGYSAPKSVVRRVIRQVDGILEITAVDSPFNSPASRSDDAKFQAAMLAIVKDAILPALQRYRDYLASEYQAAARDELSVTSIPDGRKCYEASLRAYTTVDRSGREVYRLGEQTVAENRARVVELGRTRYGLEDMAEVIVAAKADPNDKFESKSELLTFAKNAVRRAQFEMPTWVRTMPSQSVDVVPFPEHEEGTGRSAHYRPGNADRPGEYRIPLHQPKTQSRGNLEATAFHETWPGHHLQFAAAQAVEDRHPVTRIIWFSGPGEGWARYAEALAEEMRLYESPTGPLLRRAWPARGMVVDPGIHLFGWTREQAIDYMNESGRFPASQGDGMVDRIAMLPGQLTAYDSGGLEILALRSEAEAALGNAFDIRDFHDRVLENGTIPLPYLRQHIEAWIASMSTE